MIKVLLITRANPTQNIGGPGKFVPLLQRHILSTSISKNFEVVSVMGAQPTVYLGNDDFNYHNLHEEEEFMFYRAIKKVYRYTIIGPLVRNLVNVYRWQQSIRKVLLKFRPDIVHAHDFESVAFFPSYDAPIVMTNHFKGSLYREAIYPNIPEYRNIFWGKYFRSIEVKAIDRAEVLVFPSESGRQLLIEDYPDRQGMILKKSKIIYSGIFDPLKEFYAIGNGSDEIRPDTVVNIANHIPDKGIDIALHLFYKIRKIWPNSRFINFGLPGPLTKELLKLRDILGLSSVVEFKGICPHKEVLKSILEASLIIHTSRRVVFDLSLLESMALSKAIVATPVLGNIEALGEDYPLILKDNRPILTEDQLTLLKDRSRLKSIGVRLRQRYLQYFTTIKMANNYLELWKGISC